MKQFSAYLCFALVALAAAKPNYNYPVPNPQLQEVRQNVQFNNVRPLQPSTPSGIYSVVQAPPLAQFSQQAQVTQQQSGYVAQSTAAVAPAPAPVVLAQPAPQIVTTLQQQQNGQVYNSAQQHVQQIANVQEQRTQYVQQQQQQPIVQQQLYTQQQQYPQLQQQQQQQQQQFAQQQQPAVQQQVTFQQQQYQPAAAQQVIVTKDVYIHSAPEDNEELTLNRQNNIPIRKNYRIVFIKAPVQNLKLTTAALRQAQSANEEKTVIYVLSKKPDLTEVQQQLSLSQAEPKIHKPEVYFIKYKTTEEAQRAQQEIQAQYDALGGSTHISNEGIAPIGHVSGASLNLGNVLPALTTTQYVQQQGQQVVQQQLPIQQHPIPQQQIQSFARHVQPQQQTQSFVQQKQTLVQSQPQPQPQPQQQQQLQQTLTQSSVQQSFERSSSSATNSAPAPSRQYLPVKSVK